MGAAVALADRRGLGALTMRALARELGTAPKTLYHHVEDKDDILDAIVDSVFAEIDLPPAGGDWRVALRRRATSAATCFAGTRGRSGS